MVVLWVEKIKDEIEFCWLVEFALNAILVCSLNRLLFSQDHMCSKASVTVS